MKKVARLTKCHQQSFAHCIQLVVIDVLYKKEEEEGEPNQITTDHYQVEHNYADSDVGDQS
jgi:hypothetical protein